MATELAALIARSEVSARDAALAVMERVTAREADVRAWAYFDPERLLRDADRLNRAMAGGSRSPAALHGVPVAVNDLIDTADMPTAYGSERYRGHRPRADAACVTSLRLSAAVLVGKSVTTELALFRPPRTRNPLSPLRSPGGSSAGSAAAVADFMVPLALGTQTAGSVIRPASYCGVLGFVPTYGRWDTTGVKQVCPSLDRVGVFARSFDDVRLLAAVLDRAPASAPRVRRRWRVAVLTEVAEAVGALLPVLERLGEADVLDCGSLVADGAALHDALMRCELRDAYRAEIADPHGLGDETRSYLQSLEQPDEPVEGDLHGEIEAFRRHASALLDDRDVVVAASAGGEAPAATEGTGDPFFCRPWSLLGLPSLSIPVCSGPTGMPVGLQLVGRAGGDAAVVDAGEAIADEVRATGVLHWRR